ncbi:MULTISPECIES: helix-turn-helix domain-containing protein [Streptomyces]|uniref:helix-turn-helix domain-containing protein n=1 Tax=Streptomyces TaxID=1883 RepID=UPI001962B3AA|nr:MULTISPECIES: helix-turn-helix transcriptional regulator [Streptomyces]QRX92192.1 helix-turn-helix transcriptional regulator [Streptomyces noursei]UJB41939.1 helix-turn-helix transcriptional regulator [Streptomyces sp. A1-5]
MANASRQVLWEYWGTELKRHRENAALTQEMLGEKVFVSGGYIGQFEQAIRRPQLDVAIRIDQVLQTDGFFERAWRKLIDDQRYADYFAKVVELEPLTTTICEFAPMIVPGLLQTEPYMRAIMRAASPFAPDEAFDEGVQSRLDRAVILNSGVPSTYWAVLHEAVLRVPVGGPVVMAEQLEHIVRLVREHKALIQILPFTAGAYPSMGKMLKLMDFDDAPPTAYTEAVYAGTLLDDPAIVKRVQQDYDLIRAAALSPEASLALIESAAEEYRKCAPTT